MSEPNGYLIHGTAFSSKEAAFKALVSNHEQESWFQKIWDEDAQPYYFESQPQLTIRKSIAEMLDFIYDNHFDFNDDISWVIANIDFLPTDEDYYNFDGWINLSVDNHNLVLAYLAGKALGVDLVKVVEG